LPSVAKATAESMLMTLFSPAMHPQSSNPPRLSLHPGTLQAAPSAPNLSLDSPSSFLERPSSAPLRSSGLTPSHKPRVASSRVERFNRILGAPIVDLGMHSTCAFYVYQTSESRTPQTWEEGACLASYTPIEDPLCSGLAEVRRLIAGQCHRPPCSAGSHT
jgi:hypothetical protein